MTEFIEPHNAFHMVGTSYEEKQLLLLAGFEPSITQINPIGEESQWEYALMETWHYKNSVAVCLFFQGAPKTKMITTSSWKSSLRRTEDTADVVSYCSYSKHDIERLARRILGLPDKKEDDK